MKFAEEMNELNQIGVDLNGDIGTRMFSLDSVSIQKTSTRNSDVQLQISGFSADLVVKHIQFHMRQIRVRGYLQMGTG